MNYIPEYFEIIGNRLANPLPENVKGEVHHIFPKSLGGSNKKSNLVKLTSAEHFRCHYLLVDMFQDEPEKRRKMACALHFISHTRDGKKLTVEEYATIREAHAKAVSEMLKGHEVSIEARQKISSSLSGRKLKPFTEEHRKRISISKQGKKMSLEARRKMSEAKKGRTPWNKGVHNEKTRAAVNKSWAKRKAAQHLQS